MGGASSTQRGGKVTQSQTTLRESTNANTPKDMAQVANIAKNNPASLSIEDTKKDNVALTDDVTAILSQTTNPATNGPDQAASLPQPSVKSVPDVIPESADAVSQTEAPPKPQVVASQPTKGGRTFVSSTDQGRKVLGHIDTRDPNIGERKTRRGRGKRKGKSTSSGAARDGTENIPPPANPRRRRARGTGYVDIGTRPAPRRGRETSRVGGAGVTNVGNYVASQSVEALIEGVKPTGRRSTQVDKAWEHDRNGSDAGIRQKHRGRRRLASQGDSRKKPELAGRGFIPDVEIPRTDKAGLASDEDHRRSGNCTPCGETDLPEPIAEGDVSIVQPLPSSTRRRAKEYFQRRTRERSVDAVGPPHRHLSMTEQEMRPILKGSIENASVAGNRPEMIKGRRDQFVFDPEASPFTPNATSSPRQTSLSSIGVQSFSSPTPLPSHGNRKVVPLVLLPETSHGSNRLETKRDSMIPITSHDIAYTYAGANQAQAHIQAEHIALMRLQAYYNWLAGSVPPTRTGVGIPLHESEHMDMSGGGGGLSGGVALGRQGRVPGLGKGQCRTVKSAYAHPKEHVIFSPRDHERTEEEASQPVLQKGIVGESEKETRRKWDGKWGLRHVGTSGKEIGWSWGRVSSGDP